MNKSYVSKVFCAMIEGKFLKKSFNKIMTMFDNAIGRLSRNIFFGNAKVNPNKIFFMTFQGDYTCNPKYITEEIIRQNLGYEIVWAVRLSTLKRSYLLPPEIKLVDRYTFEYFKELATSKIWILNSVELFKKPIKKKKSQFLIETWHGSLGIKRFDKNANSGRSWVKAAQLCAYNTNYCISNSDFENVVYKETYWTNNNILKYGHPRNDILFLKGDDLKRRQTDIFSNLNISNSCHYVLYAPTFRDSHKFNYYDINYELLIKTLEKRFGGKWKVLVRFHPTVRKESVNFLDSNTYLIDVTKYPDIQELMLIADIGITDYSSWIYDYVLTRKPGFIFAEDIEEYNTERGFYYKLETTPFAIARNNEELFDCIMNFDLSIYQNKVDKFLSNKGCIEDGKASYRVVEKIKEIMNYEK